MKKKNAWRYDQKMCAKNYDQMMMDRWTDRKSDI